MSKSLPLMLLISTTAVSCGEQDEEPFEAVDSSDYRSDLVAKKWDCTSKCEITDYVPAWDETSIYIKSQIDDPVCSTSKAQALEAVKKLEFECETSVEDRWAKALYSCTKTDDSCTYNPESPIIGPREFNCVLKCQIQGYAPQWDKRTYYIEDSTEFVSCSDRITGARSDAKQIEFACTTDVKNQWAKTLLECEDTGVVCSK